jgi:hypothetical protein
MRIAAVLGGAKGNLDELAALRTHADVVAVYAVNDAAAEYPGDLAAFVTLHFEKLPMWLAKRRAAGLPKPREIVSHEQQPHVTRVVDYRWPGMNASGSSGLFAAKVAIEAGFDDVVLCGVPMDAERAHYFNGSPWHEVNGFFEAWEIALPHLRGRVRSMSGWTAKLLNHLHPAGGIPVLNSEML